MPDQSHMDLKRPFMDERMSRMDLQGLLIDLKRSHMDLKRSPILAVQEFKQVNFNLANI